MTDSPTPRTSYMAVDSTRTVHRTLDLDRGVLIDVSEEGHIVGIEVIGDTTPVGAMLHALRALKAPSSEREEELRREGARTAARLIQSAYHEHLDSQPPGTWRQHDKGKAEGLSDALRLARQVADPEGGESP